jgi:hypothetical protein
MNAKQPADMAEQNKSEEGDLQQPRKGERYQLDPDRDMKLDKNSVMLLDKILKQLPWLMPKRIKLKLIDRIAMRSAIVSRELGDTNVSVDDILVGLYQSFSLAFADAVCSKLKITPEKRAEYKQNAFNIDYVSMDTFLRDIKVIADLCGAEIREEKLLPFLDCFKELLEWGTIYIKTTTKELTPKELFIRPGHASRWFEVAAMAKQCGLADFYDNQAYQMYASICSKVDVIGSMVDIDVQGDIQKFYAFFGHKPVDLNKIKKCEHLPESVLKNVALLESLGLKRFSIVGVDVKKDSLNLYYFVDQTEFNGAKIERILTSLGFEMPGEQILQQMKDAVLVYFTFTRTSDQIERVCFTRVYEDDMEEAIEIVPSFREFIEKSPVKSAKRSLMLGFTFGKNGHYLKVEWDYKSSFQASKKMKYTGLYSNLDEF